MKDPCYPVGQQHLQTRRTETAGVKRDPEFCHLRWAVDQRELNKERDERPQFVT